MLFMLSPSIPLENEFSQMGLQVHICLFIRDTSKIKWQRKAVIVKEWAKIFQTIGMETGRILSQTK